VAGVGRIGLLLFWLLRWGGELWAAAVGCWLVPPWFLFVACLDFVIAATPNAQTLHCHQGISIKDSSHQPTPALRSLTLH
jgi:hypothetical protein